MPSPNSCLFVRTQLCQRQLSVAHVETTEHGCPSALLKGHFQLYAWSVGKRDLNDFPRSSLAPLLRKLSEAQVLAQMHVGR